VSPETTVGVRVIELHMTLTLGVVLSEAHERGLHVDVETRSGRVYADVTVAALDQFCIVLLTSGPGGRAHVVTRDHVVAVSMDRRSLLEIEPNVGKRTRQQTAHVGERVG
jgi:hypothetical protein